MDYVHVYVMKKYFDEMDAEITTLLNGAQDYIQNLTEKGENTTHLDQYLDQINPIWREGYYLYMPAKTLLNSIMEVLENWDQVMEMFSEAENTIDILKDQKNVAYFFIKIPSHLGYVFIPRHLAEKIKSKGDQFGFKIQLETKDKNNRTYSGTLLTSHISVLNQP